MWNHALFKGLLFLSGGAVVHATHTRDIDRLGGLLPRMPVVAAFFLLGAVAICGLPPLNGFASELLIYLGLFGAAGVGGSTEWLAPALAAPALALIGGLALACFAKLFGAAFLGEPRSGAAREAHQPGARMLGPMAVLAAGCVVVGLVPGVVAPALDGCAQVFAPGLAAPLRDHAPLGPVSALAGLLLGALGVGGLLYLARVRRSPVEAGPTWGCGYPAATPRMQYTASSFAASLVDLFSWALRPAVHRGRVEGAFPKRSGLSTHVADTVLDGVLLPLAARVASGFSRLRWLQAGNVSLYLAYVGGALLFALAWMKGASP